ncbi:MAG TPA: zinc-ribbon domain-containing protein [Terriglobales bacterium]|nr:zinc-ribbon domain-containing protein [Terriglobales bacterium]
MTHPCHQCDAPIEEGVPFCPQCGAPQIRVSPVTPGDPATPPILPGTPADVQPPAQPLEVAPPEALKSSAAVRTAFVTGLLVAVAMLLVAAIVVRLAMAARVGEQALGALVLLAYCACMLLGGALSVRLARRRNPDISVSYLTGARLGALTALFGFLIFGLLEFILVAAFRPGANLRAAWSEALRRYASQNADPRAQQIFDWLQSPAGLATVLTAILVVALVSFVVCATMGGLIAAGVWGQKRSQ